MGDEIDEILILSLKQAGINLESLNSIDAETLVTAAVCSSFNSFSASPPRPRSLPLCLHHAALLSGCRFDLGSDPTDIR